ncbi:response regulator transcription factor [Pantoea sp.]|uniref:response regulator transcription factor n=1 Tax=Pantoea sp. TaxID=69393 RepID=UPI0031D23D46
MNSISVIDSNPLIRRGLKNILTEKGYQVAFEADNVDAMFLSGINHKPQLLIIEPLFQDHFVNEKLELLRHYNPRLKILILSISESHYHIQLSLQMGFEGYVCKSWPLKTLFDSIDEINQGKHAYCSSQFTHRMKYPNDARLLASLSKREFQVLRLFGAGKSIKEISEALDLSNKTISTYKIKMMQKTSANNFIDIVDLARRNFIF